ncbi:MAG TPA: DUF169 domain-containing protein [Kofleriaceae bacterium]|nr:DUF169 domain-containing protein [Kofleriaceae bacterium]
MELSARLRHHHDRIRELLGPGASAIAVAFVDEPPAGLAHVGRSAPSGCTFWKLAADGEAFYTDPVDHRGCPVGAHTHGLPPGPDGGAGLADMVKTMVGLEYLRESEVAAIPTLAGGFRHAVYAPLAASPVAPDVVILRGSARQMMLAAEAARAAGMEGAAPVRERPTCAVIAEVMAGGRAQASFACIGNRVYTGLGEGEVYFAVPGGRLGELVDRLAAVAAANRELEAFHRARLA